MATKNILKCPLCATELKRDNIGSDIFKYDLKTGLLSIALASEYAGFSDRKKRFGGMLLLPSAVIVRLPSAGCPTCNALFPITDTMAKLVLT